MRPARYRWDIMFWNRAIETIRPEELADLQLKRLKWALRQAQEVGLYQRKFREAGISPDDIRTLDDVEKLPFTYKKELQAGYPFGLFAVPMREHAPGPGHTWSSRYFIFSRASLLA